MTDAGDAGNSVAGLSSELHTLGLVLPSPAYILGAIFFGLVGLGAWRHGRRVGRQRIKWLGFALMFYPYFVSQTWLLYVVGAALCGAVAFDRG